MLKSSKKQNLEQGAAILLLSTVIVKLIGALFKIPLSSEICLGDLGFGYFSAAYDLFTPLYIMAISGFPVAISRIIADYNAKGMESEAKRAFRVSRKTLAIIGIIGSFIMLVAVIPFVSLTDETGQSIYSVLAVVPAFLFLCIVSCYRGYFEGYSNMLPAAVSNVIEALGKLILGFSFAYITVKITGNLPLGAAAALFGITLGTLISAIYLHIRYKSDKNHLLSANTQSINLSDKEIKRMIILTAVPIVLSSLSGSLVTLIDAFTVRWQLSITATENFGRLSEIYSEVIKEYNTTSLNTLSSLEFPTLLYGIRSKAYTLYNIVPTFTMALGVSAVPVISEAFAKKDSTQILKSSEAVLKFASLIALPAGAGMFVLSKDIMVLLYGKGASASLGGKMLTLYALAAVFSGLSVVLCSVLQALSLQKKVLLNVFIGIALKITGNLVLCSIIGVNIFGAVISTLLCYLLIFLLNLFSLIKLTGNFIQVISVFLKPLIASLLCGITAYFVSLIGENSLVCLLSVMAGGAVYIISLILFKAISRQEISNFLKK